MYPIYRAPDSVKMELFNRGIYDWQSIQFGENEHLTFNQGVTGSRPVRPTETKSCFPRSAVP